MSSFLEVFLLPLLFYDHLVAGAGGTELGETAAPRVGFVIHIWLPPVLC